MFARRYPMKSRQMSESFRNAIFLALSGGFQDAYTYFNRNEVFSNAQTGNIVLMSQHLMKGDWLNALRYLLPLSSFAIGIFIAEQIGVRLKESRLLHWRQLVILIEMLILCIVGLIPHSLDMVATALVSFSCSLQVQTFRKVHGYGYASTMCIGNLRSGTAALSAYLRNRNKKSLEASVHYFGVIFFFGLGSGIGGIMTQTYGIPCIWVCDGLLLICFMIMAIPEKKEVFQ